MSKAVLISIQPKWCELIASGRKTIEVRKTKPKIPTPFKCYIYETKAIYKPSGSPCLFQGRGKVIGEFVCDEIHSILQVGNMNSRQYDYRAVTGDDTLLNDDVFDFACISKKDVNTYLKGQKGYGWHISDLKIYDKPKDLSEFVMPSEIGCCNEGKCKGCKWLDMGNGFNIEDDCFAPFDTDEYKSLRRPPQSWCYVERLEGEQ